MKYLIVGLGNPDQEYDGTRHNIGFRVLDNYIKKLNEKNNQTYSFTSDRYAFKAETKLMGRQVILIKPTTYMNLSGKAVRYWLDKERIPIENMLIIVDDLALDLGTIRLRLKGSDGGHNGLKNIIELIQTSNFNRLRFGIGSDFHKGQQVDFVLGKLSAEEEEVVAPQIEKTFDIIKSFVMVGMDKTMNMYNKK
ncbi:MAG: aminoacyl-tRNA hydrolase [Bacteroidales bacterium]|nr:aminoacyl-tRNA hydrolase [Candidatus Scybalousia scybalohippi]MCQ2325929.1 aminoacyl-tRNA hydrolase [Bacteroidales bacterium]